MASELTAIEAAVKDYLDGLYEGDADKLGRVFHPTSSLTFELNGELKPLPRDEWLAAVRSRPSAKSQGLERSDHVLQIDMSSPTSAFVKSARGSRVSFAAASAVLVALGAKPPQGPGHEHLKRAARLARAHFHPDRYARDAPSKRAWAEEAFKAIAELGVG